MGNTHAILLSGEKAGYKIVCALAMLVTSGHESAAHYQKESLTQVPRARNINLFFTFSVDFYLSPQSTPGAGTEEPSYLLPATSAHILLSPQSAQFLYFLL